MQSEELLRQRLIVESVDPETGRVVLVAPVHQDAAELPGVGAFVEVMREQPEAS